METWLQLLNTIATLHTAADKTFAMMTGHKGANVGYASDARTAIFAQFRYIGLDDYMDSMFAEFRAKAGLPAAPAKVGR